MFAAIVVGAEINRFLIYIGQQLVRNLGQANFRVSHGGSAVTINRAEIALPVDHRVANGKILRHAHQRVIDGLIAVRVIFTDYVTHDTRRLLVRTVPVVVELMHGKQHTTMNRFQAVANIR